MKAVIVADGAHAASDARELSGADLVIAADGGAQWLADLGVAPSVLIGDLDSTDPGLLARMTASGVPVERHPVDKDASDLELGLGAAVAAGADEVVVLGALGGRLDHETANLLLLGTQGPDGIHLRAVHGSTTVRLLTGPDRAELEGDPGSLVSLLAVDSAAEGVTTAGLHWPLRGERLASGSSRGLSNRIETSPASVEVASGRLLVIQIEEGGGNALADG